MVITVDVRPEVEAELSRQAAAHGRALETHAAALLENAAHVSLERTPGRTDRELIDSSAGTRGLLMDEESRAAQAGNLMELFAPVRGLLTDEEVDTLFSRSPSISRPVDFA